MGIGRPLTRRPSQLTAARVLVRTIAGALGLASWAIAGTDGLGVVAIAAAAWWAVAWGCSD